MKNISGYDIIGDIHGMASDLEALLESINYRCIEGVWQHPERKAVFVGDYIGKGDQQLKVYRIVRPMIDAGYAHGVMGNHKLNAIAFYMPDQNGGHLRDRSKPSNQEQHEAFLNEVPVDSDKHKEIIEWFLTTKHKING